MGAALRVDGVAVLAHLAGLDDAIAAIVLDAYAHVGGAFLSGGTASPAFTRSASVDLLPVPPGATARS